MNITALTISIAINAALLVAVIVLVFHYKTARDRLFRKDGFIRHQKQALSDAKEEIIRKEQVILREKGKGQIITQFFAEQEQDDGFFSKSHIIRFKFQLLLNGHPIGQAGLISQDKYKEVKVENVN